MAQVSEFLRKKAYESAKKASEQYGEDAYGGTKWREEQMVKTESNAPGTAAKTETVKPEYAKPVSFTAPSQQLFDAAEKEYNDYINSEEHKKLKLQNMAIEAAKMQQANSANSYAAKTQNQNLQVQEDTREKELRAKRDYYKNMVNAENDSHVMESDLAEIATWTEKDRADLDKYVSFRQGGITSGGFAVPAMEAYNNLTAKYGKEKVEQLSYTWQRDKNAKDAAALAERSAAAVKGNTGAAVGHSAATIPANLLGSVAGAYGVAIDLATRDKRYSTLDPNNIGTMASVYSGAVRGQVAEDIAGDGSSDVRNALSIGYQGVMSAADSIARTAVTMGSPVGLGLAASSSFSQTVSEASKQGATPAQAIVLGVGNAAIEAATEKVPLDNMLKAAKGGVKGAKAIAKEALRQAAIEATEEEISLFGNLLLEAAVLQEKSSYKQSIAEAIANGMSYEQAKEQADKAVWAEALNTAAVSAVSGGISGGGSAAFGSIFGGGAQTPVQTEQAAEVETPAQTELTAQAVPEAAAQQPQTSGQKTIAEIMAEVVANRMPNQMRDERMNGQTESAKTEIPANTNAVSKPISEYEPEKQSMIRSYLQAVDSRIKGFVDLVKNGDKTFRREKIASVSDKAAADIKNAIGVDASGYTHNINTNGVQHIINRHGAGGEHDGTMSSSEDIARVGWVLENYDRVEPVVENGKQVYSTEFMDKNNNPAPLVKFIKKIDGTYYAVEAACENKYNKLWVQSAYLQKNNGDVTQAPADDISANRETHARSDLASPSPKNTIADSSVGVKGTGAAEQNFSGKAQYQDLLYEGNVQPDRASDVRPMEVPKTDTEGNPVSATAANVYGSQYTTDDLASATEESIAKGDLSYMKITNDESAARASKKIESAGGWQEAYIQWHDEVRDGKTSAEMAARGAMLLNHAAEVYEQTKATGDEKATKEAKQQWISILVDVREMGTNTAQGLQALRMIRELAPPDKLDFAVASVKRMVASMKLQNDVKIDENLLNEYRMAETDEQRSEIMSRIQQNVADQIPSTFLDKWTALRYMNMLGNLKTNVRNVAGNVGSMIAYRLKDKTAALMEELVSVVNKDFQRTKSHIVSKEMLDFARNDFNKIKTAVKGGGKYNERMAAADEFRQGVMDKRRVFKSDNKVLNAVMTPLEGYRKGTNWMMNNKYFGDEAFGRAAYARALAGFLKANGVKDTELSNVNPELMDKARAYAIQQAQEATFKDNTALANIVSKVQKSTGIVGQAIMPFTKTPANILVRATEFSPIGILDTAAKAARMGLGNTSLTSKNGIVGDIARSGEQITGTDIVNSLAKTMTGTALFALGAALFDQGLLSAGPDDDEKQAAFDKLNGKQPYSLQFEINGEKHSYTMDWLTPVAMPMFMGAEFWKMMQESDGEMTFADYEQLFTSIADPMIQMSMLQGLNDTLESIKWSDNNLGQFFINAAISYLTQGITNTLVGQLEKTTEKNRMTTYVDKDSAIPVKMQQALGKASQKVPGWDFQQMEYRNAWGQVEQNEGGLLYNLASPGYLSKEEETRLTNELNRLYDVTKENVFPQAADKTVNYTDKNGNLHEDYNLSQEEYEKMQKTQGQTAADILNNLVKNSDYRNLTDQQKAATISAVYEFAKEKGKRAALPNYYSNADAWIADAKETDLKTFITQGTKSVMNKAIQNAVSNVSNGWSVTSAAKKDMDQSYASYRKLSQEQKDAIKDQIDGDTKKYIEVRESGVTTQNYLDAVKNVKKLGEDAKDAEIYAAVAATPNAYDRAKDALMKAYMDDYNPNHTQPDTTELKYDYIREKMQLSPEKYVKAFRIYSSINSTKTEEIKRQGYVDKESAYKQNWVKAGFTTQQADELYNLWVSGSKYHKIDVVSWHNGK